MNPAPAPNLKRLRACRDIPRHNVHKGDYGGYVYGPEAITQEGDCWIAKHVFIKDNSTHVSGNTLVDGTGEYKHYNTNPNIIIRED